jgi:aspartate racemase
MPDSLIHRRFEAQARLRPGAIAVETDRECLTYAGLDARADRLAGALVAAGVKPETPVGIFAERGIETVVGLLGILKAGGAYFPLDPGYPSNRLAMMLEDVRPPVILAKGSLIGRLPETAANVLKLEGEFAGQPVGCPSTCVTGDSLAYLPFTSGSTGRPKGVEIVHHSVVRLVCGNDYADFGPDQTFLHLAPLAFDASTFEIWGALLNGGRLVIAPPGTLSLTELGDVLRRHRVTTLWLTAGLFHLMVDERLDDLGGLRQLLAGGDALSVRHVRRVRERFPHLRLVNGYGPTEATTFACCHTVV